MEELCNAIRYLSKCVLCITELSYSIKELYNSIKELSYLIGGLTNSIEELSN